MIKTTCHPGGCNHGQEIPGLHIDIATGGSSKIGRNCCDIFLQTLYKFKDVFIMVMDNAMNVYILYWRAATMIFWVYIVMIVVHQMEKCEASGCLEYICLNCVNEKDAEVKNNCA